MSNSTYRSRTDTTEPVGRRYYLNHQVNGQIMLQPPSQNETTPTTHKFKHPCYPDTPNP